MKYIRLSYLKKEHGFLKERDITLTGSTGKLYNCRALLVPEYGWIPCSRRLRANFTRDPEKLTLVIEEPDDPQTSVTSDKWVALNNVVLTLGSELVKHPSSSSEKQKEVDECDDLPF